MSLASCQPHEPRFEIAIAEDDDDLRDALEQVFLAEGFEVFTFEDGFELADYFAQACCEHHWPCAIITDIDMPGRTGLEAVAEARSLGAEVPVFFITGLNTAEVQAHAASLCNTLVFQKPVDAQELAHAIRSFARARRTTESTAKKP